MRLFSNRPKAQGGNRLPEAFQADQAVRVKAGLSMSVGKTRDHMEDAAYSLVIQQGYCDQKRNIGLFIIADGMGGHSNGELASSIAIQSFVDSLRMVELDGGQAISADRVSELLEEALNKAQQAVLEKVSGGGSTLTAALVVDREITFAHVGDSRLYLIDGRGKTELLTRDHSLVQRLVDLGQISNAEADLHPQKNVLYRALGQTDGFKVDSGSRELPAPAHLLLCSDGLWGLLEEKQLAEQVCLALSVEERAEKLCQLANDAGGTDNISVIVVDIF